MTNCIAVADIHLNLSKNREFESNRFLQLFKVLKEDEASIIFILGDTFDKPNPSLEEIGLFYKAMAYLKDKTVYVIDGNHENLSKSKSTFDYLPQIGFRYIKDDQIKIEGVRVYLVSWSEIGNLKRKVEGGITSLPNILLTHIRSNVPPHIKEEIPLKAIANTFDKIVAGDIHITNFKPYDNWWYTGQAYNTNYKREGLNSILELTFDKGVVEIKPIYTYLPNKVLQVLTVEEAKAFNRNDANLYKLRVQGSFSDVANLQDTNNVTYDKILNEVDYSKYEKVADKIDIATDIKTFINSEYELPEASIKFGEAFVDKTLKDKDG